MIYFIVTTSLYNNSIVRRNQYYKGIRQLKKTIKDLLITNYKLIIVENNGLRKTFLDGLGDVFYTNNNYIKTNNKGIKELIDIKNTISKYNINDNDFIVKMTGRYIINNNSEFMNIIKNIKVNKYDCVIKFGSIYKIQPKKIEDDCITGLIGMTCFYVKQVEIPQTNKIWVEWEWAKIANKIKKSKIYQIKQLGINICPQFDINIISSKYYLF
tara:strand:+ start:287 stop:925 length:639 start_codon:yes stop_codon:yes gene_type:complete